MPPPIFVSYASDDCTYPSDQKLFMRFFDDLVNEVSLNMPGLQRKEIAFLAGHSIRTGNDWPADLGEALRTARLLVAFYSPRYFASTWCGREVQTFLSRHDAWAVTGRKPGVIVPVLWSPCENLPASLRKVQFADDDFPDQYRKRGLRRIMDLGEERDYTETKAALAERILDALKNLALPEAESLGPMDSIPSAFDCSPSAIDDQAPNAPRPRSAYFVFAAAPQNEMATVKDSVDAWGSRSWDWTPYHPEALEPAGAVAQLAAGNKQLRFMELACDDTLPDQLLAAKNLNEPVVIVADPWSLRLEDYRRVMKRYDELLLLNCGLLMAWNENDPETRAERPELDKLIAKTCSQKRRLQTAGHHWDIRSHDEFRRRMSTILDEITMQLVDTIPADQIAQAQSDELAAAAAERGIPTDKPSQLVNTDADVPRP
jgi:FxsC-like protein